MRLIVVLVAASVLAVPVALAKGPFPATIPLPNGWQPEGIATGNGKTFYAGSRATGAVYSGDLRTGKGVVLVPAVAAGRRQGSSSTADGSSSRVPGQARRSSTTRRPALSSANTSSPLRPTFINDVAVTNDAAYFTDSNRAVIFKLPLGSGGTLPAAAQELALTGDFQLVPAST